MRRLAKETSRPVSFALNQNNNDPEQWRKLLALAGEALAEGVPIRPQVTARTVSILLGFQTFHPLAFTSVWGASGIGLLPWREQVERLRSDIDLRARIVEEARSLDDNELVRGFMSPERTYLLGNPPNYEPGPSDSVAGIAAARGAGKWETFLDLLMEDDGRQLLNSPVLNYSFGNLEATREMLVHPATVYGLSDGGAHAGQTCDASTTTFMLSYWARDRKEGRLPIEEAVRQITSATADLYGLSDRGRLVPGSLGDVNVIDADAIGLHRPEVAADLPGGASRLVQRADGYRYTVKTGEVIFHSGQATGALPGTLLRGAR
jgi:N-acyl-D-aspartate/D-glutamate deacylase